MLVTSTSVSLTQSVIISRKKSILGFGTALKSILFGTISSICSINDNVFLSDLANGLNFFFRLATSGLFFLPRCAKSSLSKFKSSVFVVQYLFCMVAIHLQNWCMMDLLNQCQLLFPLETLQLQHDCTFHVCPP